MSIFITLLYLISIPTNFLYFKIWSFITSKLDDSELKWYLNNGGDGDRKYVLRDGTDFNNFIKDQIKKYKGLYFDERPDWRGEVTKEELDAYLKS